MNGSGPTPPSKKQQKEFDSFVLPPPDKKGIKPVQSPGPFLLGTFPRYVSPREEILSEPLTQQEIDALGMEKEKLYLLCYLDRDGLTHNMLDNIHAHWKRKRVCKIKCKGVCRVDMDNVCRQLEKGWCVVPFRGRNYNYGTRPRFPLMLWKPVPPVYPKLVKRVPEGLTLQQVTEMRKKGRELIPICKLGKNVREAFEECELVRINCQGLNKSDYRKIGAKLRDLVPCVLLSYLCGEGKIGIEVSSPIEDSKQSVTSATSLARKSEAECINNVTGSYGERESRWNILTNMTLSDDDSHANCPSEAWNESNGAEDMMDSKSCSDGPSTSVLGSEFPLPNQLPPDQSLGDIVRLWFKKLPSNKVPLPPREKKLLPFL
ncbi:CRS2-associated factor 1 [Arachis hypogaea]|nr:CRS2-associated factor 1 [Arachis hypogaea]